MDDFEYWYKYFLSEEKRAYDEGWHAGFEAGRRQYHEQREEDWAELFAVNPWWVDRVTRPDHEEMEERRYGSLPAGEYSTAEGKRIARATAPREGDFQGAEPW